MIKTYEEFNWNPFKKKKDQYNDYIGLHDIDALDQFNDITGRRHENIVEKLIKTNGIKYYRFQIAENYAEFYFKNFYGEWVTFTHLFTSQKKEKISMNKLNVNDPGRSKTILPNIYITRLVDLDEDMKKRLINFFKNMKDEEYKKSMEKIRKYLTTKVEK